jgi:hypothetical protein
MRCGDFLRRRGKGVGEWFAQDDHLRCGCAVARNKNLSTLLNFCVQLVKKVARSSGYCMHVMVTLKQP